MTSTDLNRQKLTQLRKLLIQHFSLDELRVLCFDLGLEYEDLSGSTRTTKMHGLIEYLQRRSELPRLLDEASDHRPNVVWPSFDNENPAALKDEPTGRPQSFIHKKSGLEMLLIPAGEFLYGEKKEPKFLPDFWMAKTQVTNAHYNRFVQETGHKPPKHWRDGSYSENFAHHPVVYVSWDDAVAYTQWAGLRIPTEQQWEKAASGKNGWQYPWGNEWKPYCNTKEASIHITTPIGYYSPFGDSQYGCIDMSGNVWEWTDSWFDEKEKFHVVKGGSWAFTMKYTQIGFRGNFPNRWYSNLGFRAASPFGLDS